MSSRGERQDSAFKGGVVLSHYACFLSGICHEGWTDG